MRFFVLIAAVVTALPAPLGAAPAAPTGAAAMESVTRPSAEELEHAWQRHDPVELERLGARLGAVRLGALVERGSPDAQRAALAALELIDGGFLLLPRLIAVADRDQPDAIAELCVQSVRRIAERVGRGEIDLEELPTDLPRAAVKALVALAGREARPIPLRVEALAALAALASLAPTAPALIAAFTSDRNPQIRRAAADALPPGAETQRLVRLLVEDGVANVAAAAAASLCRDVVPPGAEKKSERLALQRLASLPPAARARLRALVVDESLLEADRLDLIPCLRPGAQKPGEQKDDLEILRALGKGPDGALRRRARTYGGR